MSRDRTPMLVLWFLFTPLCRITASLTPQIAVLILTETTFVIGRALGTSALCFPEDRSISRAHATLRADRGETFYDIQKPQVLIPF